MAPSTIRQPHRPYYAVGGCYRLQEGPTDSTPDSDYSSSESSSFSESGSYDDSESESDCFEDSSHYATLGSNYRVPESCTDYDSDSDDDSRSESESDCTDDSIACLDDLLEPEDS